MNHYRILHTAGLAVSGWLIGLMALSVLAGRAGWLTGLAICILVLGGVWHARSLRRMAQQRSD